MNHNVYHIEKQTFHFGGYWLLTGTLFFLYLPRPPSLRMQNAYHALSKGLIRILPPFSCLVYFGIFRTLPDQPGDVGGGQEIGVVGMEHGPLQNRQGQVQKGSAVGNKGDFVGQDAARVVESHPIASGERVALPGPGHVFGPTQAQLHGPARGLGGQSGQAGPDGRAALLAAKGSAWPERPR